jgi:hypothetical protein
MKEITRECPAEFLVLVKQTKISNPDPIGSPLVTLEEYDRPNNNRRKKKEEVHEMNITSKETTLDSPGGGGDDEVEHEENEGEENKHEHGKVTLPKDPITEAKTSKKINISSKKP